MSAPTDRRRATGERDAILNRVRVALETPTSEHVLYGKIGGTDIPVCVSDSTPSPGDTNKNVCATTLPYSTFLPAVGSSLDDRLAIFAERSTALKTDFHIVMNIDAAIALLHELAISESWKRIAYHADATIAHVAFSLATETMRCDPHYDRQALEQCDAGITACDALIAQTGSVLLTAASAGGRALSVLPPHHVVIATVAQLLPDLPAAYAWFAAKYGDQGGENWPSFATFITGPSRTGDIERILVLGAHGPKKLTVVLIDDRNVD